MNAAFLYKIILPKNNGPSKRPQKGKDFRYDIHRIPK